MNIREAKIEDIDNNLLNLFIEGFKYHKENRPEMFPDFNDIELKNELLHSMYIEENKFLVLEEDNKIIGFLSYKIKTRINKKFLWIDEFVIDEQYRRKGYGKLFIDEIRKIAKEKECARIELNCWIFNESAIEFYNKLGFKKQRIVFEEMLNNDII